MVVDELRGMKWRRDDFVGGNGWPNYNVDDIGGLLLVAPMKVGGTSVRVGGGTMEVMGCIGRTEEEQSTPAAINFSFYFFASITTREAKQELRLVVGVDEEVRKLEGNLRTVYAVLEDAEKRQMKEHAVRLWLEKLKDVSYEMDNVLDEWNTAMIKSEIEKEEEETAANDPIVKKKKKILEVRHSSILSERCQKGSGEDWAKIFHIPNIQIDGKYVQRDGREVNSESESSSSTINLPG
ncbi:hypothetical protein CMV_015776 [Castanea mollissima]|uniref:Disease resistance N-terminal domain-containing protein n=1 Tax=Castanea mollissima TaxID=60419 RepID=A0A8J4R9C5_9ROSI|nr:hypothetical protein CMV_015776 [Castanea mollissima]